MTEKRSNDTEMEERGQRIYNLEDDEIDLRDYFSIFSQNVGKILFLSLTGGIITLFIMFLMPNIYKATAIIAPAGEDQKNLPSFSALASTFGIQLGGPSKVEDLEALFKSNDLTVRVFNKYNLWPVVFPEDFDQKTGMLKVGLIDRLLHNKGAYQEPSDWDAIRAADDCLSISANRKNDTLSISFESLSPEGSAKITQYYINEAKSRLQEEALDRAGKNKKFIEEQIGKTVDALNRDRLYTLLTQEVEREMMARNREQFGFRIIDLPRVPDKKFKPRRGLSAILAFVLSFFAASLYCIWASVKKTFV